MVGRKEKGEMKGWMLEWKDERREDITKGGFENQEKR